jgi:hypothetical protein
VVQDVFGRGVVIAENVVTIANNVRDRAAGSVQRAFPATGRSTSARSVKPWTALPSDDAPAVVGVNRIAF